MDNKSQREGLSCPPPQFLEESELEKMKNVMVPEKSILVLNLVCRNDELKLNYMQKLAKHFKFICYYDVPEEVNRIVFCFSEERSENNEFSTLIHKSVGFITNNSDRNKSISSSKENKNKKGTNTSKTSSIETSQKTDRFDGVLDDPEEISDSFKIYC